MAAGLPTGNRQGAFETNTRWRGIAVIVALVLAVLLPLSFTGPWRLLEARVFDYLSTLAPPPRPADGPVIVAIDEPSFAEIGLQWPWPRDLHARLVESLRKAGARTIGLDIIFAEPSARREADGRLAASLGPDVVLAADLTEINTPQATQTLRVEPLQELTAAGATSGLASIVLDRDGSLRHLPRFPDSFSAVLLRKSGGQPPGIPSGALFQTFGPARTYPTVSYYQALDPDEFLPQGIFTDKVVIVGLSMQAAPTSDTGGAEAFATPQTLRTGHLTSGAEIHATIFDNLRTGLFVREAPVAVLLGTTVLAALAAGLTVRRATGWRTIAVAAGAVAFCIAASFLFLRFGRLFAPPITPSLAFLTVATAQGARDYAAERRLRRTITRAFSQYLAPVLVERLARDPSQLRLGGEKRKLTILFSDVRGFTTISERLKDDPQRLTALINRLLNPLSSIILASGGTIDKYIGDAIMAFWNAPLEDPDHAVHAIAAALEMLSALDGLNAELAAEAAESGSEPLRLAIGVGLNTGECVVGNMGSDIRFNYSVLGDSVNLAARLEGETKAYGVSLLLGAETARLAARRYAIVELDRVLVKGKTEPATVSTVVPVFDGEARAAHQLFLDDLYAGQPVQALARIERLSTTTPPLAAYYRIMRKRLEDEIGGL